MKYLTDVDIVDVENSYFKTPQMIKSCVEGVCRSCLRECIQYFQTMTVKSYFVGKIILLNYAHIFTKSLKPAYKHTNIRYRFNLFDVLSYVSAVLSLNRKGF